MASMLEIGSQRMSSLIESVLEVWSQGDELASFQIDLCSGTETEKEGSFLVYVRRSRKRAKTNAAMRRGRKRSKE